MCGVLNPGRSGRGGRSLKNSLVQKQQTEFGWKLHKLIHQFTKNIAHNFGLTSHVANLLLILESTRHRDIPEYHGIGCYCSVVLKDNII